MNTVRRSRSPRSAAVSAEDQPQQPRNVVGTLRNQRLSVRSTCCGWCSAHTAALREKSSRRARILQSCRTGRRSSNPRSATGPRSQRQHRSRGAENFWGCRRCGAVAGGHCPRAKIQARCEDSGARASRPQQPRTREGATNFQRSGSGVAAAAGDGRTPRPLFAVRSRARPRLSRPAGAQGWLVRLIPWFRCASPPANFLRASGTRPRGKRCSAVDQGGRNVRCHPSWR